jgi:peptidoglycan hydrolase-like protein with peptidoglycan-binding domain
MIMHIPITTTILIKASIILGTTETSRSGDVISAVQSALMKRGYYRGPIDGVIGASSRRAIRTFQANQGLPVTGLIDRKLISALQLG